MDIHEARRATHFLSSLTLVEVLEVEKAVAAFLLSILGDDLQLLQEILIGSTTVACKWEQAKDLARSQTRTQGSSTCRLDINELFVLDVENHIAKVLL